MIHPFTIYWEPHCFAHDLTPHGFKYCLRHTESKKCTGHGIVFANDLSAIDADLGRFGVGLEDWEIPKVRSMMPLGHFGGCLKKQFRYIRQCMPRQPGASATEKAKRIYEARLKAWEWRRLRSA